MNIYLDTNVLLSWVNDKDIFHDDAELILNQLDIVFNTGFLTLIELRSVLKRLIKSKLIIINTQISETFSNLTENQIIDNLTEYLIMKNHIKVIPASCLENVHIGNETYTTENGLIMAYKLAKEIPIRTLDLIQISSALKIKLLSSSSVDFFLTNDKMILENVEIIRQRTKIVAISTKQCIDMLKLEKK